MTLEYGRAPALLPATIIATAAVLSPIASWSSHSCTGPLTPISTSCAPAATKLRSYTTLCCLWMTISFFIPVVSGSRRTRAGSVPVMHAAASRTIPAADPAVTRPTSAPVTLAMTSPAFWLSSFRSTNHLDASSIACNTAGGMMLPPNTVRQDAPLISLRTPIFS